MTKQEEIDDLTITIEQLEDLINEKDEEINEYKERLQTIKNLA